MPYFTWKIELVTDILSVTMDSNNLAHGWVITHHLPLLLQMCGEFHTNRTFLGMYYKKLLVKVCNHWLLYFICYNHDKVWHWYYEGLIKFFVCIFCHFYTVQFIFLMLTPKCLIVTIVIMNQCHCKPYAIYVSLVSEHATMLD